MAFGDLVQEGDSGFNITQSITFGSTATSGNILIFVATNNTAATVSSAPSGWTELETNLTGGVAGAFYYKDSDGTETAVSLTWSTGQGVGYFAEYEFQQTLVTPVVSGEDTTNISTNTSGGPSGSVTPSNPTNLWVGGMVSDAESAHFGGSWSGGREDRAFTNNGQSAPGVISATDVTGATSYTFSGGGGSQENWGFAAVFEYSSGGGAASPGIEVVRTIPGVAH